MEEPKVVGEKTWLVGDRLAFHTSGTDEPHWQICRISRILPSGRIICGPFILNPDLTVRGRDNFSPFRGESVTEEIQAAFIRQRCLGIIRRTDFAKLPQEVLIEIVGLIKRS